MCIDAQLVHNAFVLNGGEGVLKRENWAFQSFFWRGGGDEGQEGLSNVR